MKILVAYFSLTGNTRKIAEAIMVEMVQFNKVKLMTIDKIDNASLKTYDLVFIGTPIHAGGMAPPVRHFFESLPDNPRFKLAAFITHASSAYNQEGFTSGIQQVRDFCKNKEIACLGCFDCQGRLTPELHDIVQKAQKVSDEEWAEKMAECDKHPDAKDELKARTFAGKILAQAAA